MSTIGKRKSASPSPLPPSNGRSKTPSPTSNSPRHIRPASSHDRSCVLYGQRERYDAVGKFVDDHLFAVHPNSEPARISSRSRSPVLMCAKWKSLKILPEIVPLPLPVTPRHARQTRMHANILLKTPQGFRRSFFDTRTESGPPHLIPVHSTPPREATQYAWPT